MATQPNKDSLSMNNPKKPRPEDTILTETAPGLEKREMKKMVSEAAYFRALSRDFKGGNPLKDWLEAEKEVTAKRKG